MRYDTDFSDEQLNGVFNEYTQNAGSYFEDDGKMKNLFSKVKSIICKITAVPIIGKYANDILDIMDMVSDYRSGTYTVLPKKTVIAFTAVLLYIATPIDLIPDFIPMIGWVDDAAIIAIAYKKGLQKDLEDYRNWRELNIIAQGDVIDCG